MKLGWKIALGAIAVILGYAVLHVSLVLRPDVFFSHNYTRRNITVYMRETVPAEIGPILAETEARLEQDPLYNAGRHYRVYIFNNPALARYLLLRKIPFACNQPNGATYIVQADVAADTVFCQFGGPGDDRVRTLTESIAHEITHDSIRKHVGWRAERALPQWLKEGYCECIGGGCPLDGEMALSLVGTLDPYATPGYFVFHCRLLVAYLLYVDGRSVEDLLADPPNRWEVERRFMADWKSDRAGLLHALRLPAAWISAYLDSNPTA